MNLISSRAHSAVTPLVFWCLLSLSGCHEPGQAPQHAWSVSESHLLAQNFVQRCAQNGTWVSGFLKQHQRKAIVRVRGIVNHTGKSLNTRLLAQDLAASLELRQPIRVAPATVPADFLLQGDLHLSTDMLMADESNGALQHYRIKIEIITLPTGEPVCTAMGVLRYLKDV